MPVEVRGLASLVLLSLQNNDLATYPTAIDGIPALLILYLSGNQLTTLPAEIGNLQYLSLLGVSRNLLTGDISPWAKPLSTSSGLPPYMKLLISDGAGGNNCLNAGGDEDLAEWLSSKDANWNACT